MPDRPAYTARQGQFLAFIHHYRLVHGCAPAEADMQRFFQITPPSVHSMVLTLERRGFISRVPGQPRSIALLAPADTLPPLLSPVGPDLASVPSVPSHRPSATHT